jgi:hypothetical protein
MHRSPFDRVVDVAQQQVQGGSDGYGSNFHDVKVV